MLNRATDAIAHFLGLFKLQDQDVRDRLTYDEIARSEEKVVEDPELKNGDVETEAPYKLRDYNPGIEWEGEPFAVSAPGVLPPLSFQSPLPADLPIDLFKSDIFSDSFFPPWIQGFFAPFYLGSYSVVFPPYVPGSIAVVALQQTRLSDRDIVLEDGGLAAHSELLSPRYGFDALEPLVEPFEFHIDLQPPANEDAIAGLSMRFVETAETVGTPQTIFDEMPEGTTVVKGTPVHSGTFINGDLVIGDQAPVDMPASTDEDDIDEPAHDITSGENTLINSAWVFEAGSTAPVKMAAGNYVTLDMIIQYNIATDLDLCLALVAPGDGPPQSAIEAVNSALISVEARDGHTDLADNDPALPQSWTVSRLEGNLVHLNWVYQQNYVLDDDTISMMSFGSETFLQAGANTSFNLMSLVEIGFRYDLIVVGGSIYDVNVIEQYNMLNDDDSLWLAGASADGGFNGAINDLSNDAVIARLGETEFEELTSEHSEAIDTLASGSDAIGPDILSLAASGSTHINVLFIEGSILNLNYIYQANRLSDADQIELLISGAEDDWLIESGGNVMANGATIIDSNLDAMAYVGGEIYSDAVILQANLIDEAPAPDEELASEAVVFLADEMIASSENEADLQQLAHADSMVVLADPMQSVLA